MFSHTRRAPTQGFGATHSSSRHQLNRERESYFCCESVLHALSSSNQFMRIQTPKTFLFTSTQPFAPLSMLATYVVNTVDDIEHASAKNA
jgi:hypothetical protein